MSVLISNLLPEYNQINFSNINIYQTKDQYGFGKKQDHGKLFNNYNNSSQTPLKIQDGSKINLRSNKEQLAAHGLCLLKFNNERQISKMSLELSKGRFKTINRKRVHEPNDGEYVDAGKIMRVDISTNNKTRKRLIKNNKKPTKYFATPSTYPKYLL
ncbi:hypothetical protein M0812_10087 [Anaeramoeba flamelloides]|uniref:Uncharacterized protein n=1 Tax=Anaeramoeba flamelloides TaxID=1746091 RepID=A0AAV7ZWA4_9EUKA|nr:hypothetical protein M0812_10087 [Anaeramoeba flamelloides]